MSTQSWYEVLFWTVVKAFAGVGLGSGSATMATELPTLHDRPSAEDELRRTIVTFALAQVGEKYTYGIEHDAKEANPDGWDCSELTQNAYLRAGLQYTDGCVNQKAQIGHRQTFNPKPGDVFFFGPNANGIPHTGIYTGRGTAVHALGGKVGQVVERPLSEVETHPRFEGWFRHTDFAFPKEDRAHG